MFKVPECEKLVTAIFPKLLSAVMLRMGSCVGLKVKKNKKDAMPYLSPLTYIEFPYNLLFILFGLSRFLDFFYLAFGFSSFS